jgi:hypothetical protein
MLIALGRLQASQSDFGAGRGIDGAAPCSGGRGCVSGSSVLSPSTLSGFKHLLVWRERITDSAILEICVKKRNPILDFERGHSVFRNILQTLPLIL